MGDFYEFSGHENIVHARMENLGYDWDRAADPHIPPRRPFRVYLPETPEEVAEAILEAKRLGRGDKIRVRSRGHSSNHLILADRDHVLLMMEYMDRIEPVENDSVWIHSGVVLADLDAHLGERGYGLPVIGDHNHITAGGFASVGGVSPASNKRGLFIDNVEEIEYADWDGNLQRRTRDQESDFYRLLGGLGKNGVLTRLRCRVLRVDKAATILANDRKICCSVDRFLEVSSERIMKPGQPPPGDSGPVATPPVFESRDLMERGLWLDFIRGPVKLRIGQYSTYGTTPQTWWRSLSNRLTHGCLHFIGYCAGRMPGPLAWLEYALQTLGVAGLIFSPRSASIKNIEAFADRIVDTAIGEPHRMLIVFAPVERYADLFRELNRLCLEFRERGCITFFMIYVKSIRSPYLSLAQGTGPSQRFCEYVVYVGLRPSEMRHHLDELVSRLDDLCIQNGAMRYMHTRTVGPGDPRRAEIDPNARVARNLAAHADAETPS